MLVEMGMVQEDAILPFIESHLGVPAVRLRDGMIDPVAVRLLPRRMAEQLDAIALFKVRDTLCVAMADPQNLEQLDEIERITRPARCGRCSRSAAASSGRCRGATRKASKSTP